jgi:hypothetical protein
MFEKASRMKLRFETTRGNLTTEDLWDLPLTSKSGFCLDEVAKSLNRKIKDGEDESFVVEKSEEDNTLNLMFSIVKHIIKVRLDEIKARKNAIEAKEKKRQIMDLIEEKKKDSLKNLSIEELEKMINN